MPLIRTLLLHTGGRFWVDVTGIEGMRDHTLLRWVPQSPRVELGLLPSALSSLSLLSDEWGRRVSHFMLDLSPSGPSPFGESGQLAVAVAALWYRHAALAGLPLVRAGADPGPGPWSARPMVILTGSGALRPQHTSHGLFGYRVESVRGWQDKLRHLGAAVRESPCAEVHLLCPRFQLAQVRRALLWTLSDHGLPGCCSEHVVHHDRTGNTAHIWLHPVSTLGEIAGVVDALAASLARPPTMPGRAARARQRTRAHIRPARVASSRRHQSRDRAIHIASPDVGSAAQACARRGSRPRMVLTLALLLLLAVCCLGTLV